MAATQYSMQSIKRFTYNGDASQTWSNRYYFDGAAPADSAAWYALFDAVTDLEKACFAAGVTIIEARGFGPSSGLALANKAYAKAGTLATTGSHACPGDCAAVLRMATSKLSVKNHPVYLFSYIHGVRASDSGDSDAVLTAQKNAIQALGDAWHNGIVVGGRTYKRTTPDGVAATGAAVDTYVGHRDFL